MVSIKEIRNKITSIKNTKKITKAMEMVAASKMRKTQNKMLSSLPYSIRMIKVIKNLTLRNLGYKHPYLCDRKVKRIGYLVISTDRGLVGSLNSNLFKILLKDINKWEKKGIQIDLALIGSKSVSFCKLIKNKVIAKITGIGDNLKFIELTGFIKILLESYNKKKIDKIFILSNKFIKTTSYVPVVKQIIPLFSKKNNINKKFWDYLYEPDFKILLNIILNRYIESQIYQSVIENLATEQAARMIAMKTATDNGNSLIKDLELISNKVRQSNITQEINEIISGSTTV